MKEEISTESIIEKILRCKEDVTRSGGSIPKHIVFSDQAWIDFQKELHTRLDKPNIFAQAFTGRMTVCDMEILIPKEHSTLAGDNLVWMGEVPEEQLINFV